MVNQPVGGYSRWSNHLFQGRFTRVTAAFLTVGNCKCAGQVKLQADRQVIKGTV